MAGLRWRKAPDRTGLGQQKAIVIGHPNPYCNSVAVSCRVGLSIPKRRRGACRPDTKTSAIPSEPRSIRQATGRKLQDTGGLETPPSVPVAQLG